VVESDGRLPDEPSAQASQAHGRGHVPLDGPARIRLAVAAHHDFVWRQVRRWGIAVGDVDDVVQQAFVVFAERVDTVEVGAERAFLYSTARHASSNQRRVAGRRREAHDEEAVAVAVDPAARLDDIHAARVTLDRLLDGMDDDLRAVLVLYEVEEMTVPEIAALLTLPTGTVSSRLRRAREDITARLTRHGLMRGVK
jgi:RNA polymerase sigma-70 factor, ECF subfamily